MKSRRIYVIGGSNEYASWMEASEILTSIDGADLVVLGGGEDVCPFLYGKEPHQTTSYNASRDKREIAEAKIAISRGIPICGVCRGSQLACVMAGGSLVQHQSHPSRHKINVVGEPHEITVSSSHHQRQNPWGHKINFRLLGWCSLSPFNWGQPEENLGRDNPEVEIALYPDIKALAIQSHPEYCYPPSTQEEVTYINYCRKLLDDLLETK